MTLQLWLLVLSPLLVGALIIAGIRGYDRFLRYRYDRARRIRDANIKRFGLVDLKGTRDCYRDTKGITR